MEMIDLDPVEDDDAASLKQLIYDHYLYTGSTVAKFVLDDLENQLRHFVKVFPKDYKRALSIKESALNTITK
jgi:glutamate synthase (NADPH/NADH) large chain